MCILLACIVQATFKNREIFVHKDFSNWWSGSWKTQAVGSDVAPPTCNRSDTVHWFYLNDCVSKYAATKSHASLKTFHVLLLMWQWNQGFPILETHIRIHPLSSERFPGVSPCSSRKSHGPATETDWLDKCQNSVRKSVQKWGYPWDPMVYSNIM